MRISVSSLSFPAHPFRKLGGLKIELAERITLVAGHNGIGKSTILGLVAGTCGLTDSEHRTYLGQEFYSSIEQIIHVGLSEVAIHKGKPGPTVVFDVDGTEVSKRCSLTIRAAYKRARVVPRNVPHEDVTLGTLVIGTDAKIPLPTIYVGIKRLLPPGEANEKEVNSAAVGAMDDADRKLLRDFVNAVIPDGGASDAVTEQTIKGAKKRTVQPGYAHDALAVSLGQDSLSTIGAALASFQRLKRELKASYPGGLLVIDELDAGLHPHAIGLLAKALKNHAKKLDLQVLATTHSPRLIEALHPDGGGNERAPDKVRYLVDTKVPRLADDQSLQAILDDMSLKIWEPPAKTAKPVMRVYFEDLEASEYFTRLIDAGKRTGLAKKLKVTVKLIPLGVGGSNLVKLPKHDPIFKRRVLVVDADTSLPGLLADRENMLKLPGGTGAKGRSQSPEATVRDFLKDCAKSLSAERRQRLKPDAVTTNLVNRTFFEELNPTDKRESLKAWWRLNWRHIKNWGVIEAWCAENASVAADFHQEVEAVFSHVSSELRTKKSASAKV
jgi:predicted ATPase